MTAAVLWKEYRQQRAVWVAIAMLAILLVVILAVTMGKGTGWQVFHDRDIRAALNTVVVTLAIAYGLVSGALLLAGENDDGTLVFLDCLTGWRGVLWTRKCLAGAFFTLSQSLVLAILAIGLGFGSWHSAIILPLVGLDALAWGLLAGALCGSVLTAVLAGIGFMVVTWAAPLTFLFFDSWEHITIHTALGLAAGYASRRVFCKNDETRLAEEQAVARYLLPAFLRDVRVLIWLIVRQGRWVLAAGIAASLVLGFTVHLSPRALWPLGMLALGLAFGLAAFAPDQREQMKYLGAQRIPPGRIWGVKILLWGGGTISLTVLTLLIGVQLSTAAFLNSRHDWFKNWFSDDWRYSGFDTLLLLGIWPLYGFCSGQFFGMAARRPVIAFILAAVITPLAIVLWLPSLLVGGVPIWQVAIIPVLLLLTSRLAMWTWMSGRLWTLKPLIGITCAGILMTLSLTGSLWYRAVQIPDVGEPFDVNAFRTSLPSPEHNEAGPLMRSAAAELSKRQEEAQKKHQAGIYFFHDFEAFKRSEAPRQNEEISQKLDLLFQGEWAKNTKRAAHLPLGMIVDPRQANLLDAWQQPFGQYPTMASLYVLRASQMQANGDTPSALDHLEIALALSRQVKNYAPSQLYLQGCHMEDAAVSGYRRWLESAVLEKAFLKQVLAAFLKHEAANPDPGNTVKADYLLYLNSDLSFLLQRWRLEIEMKIAYTVPWEKQRQKRIVPAVIAGGLRVAKDRIGVRAALHQQFGQSTNILQQTARVHGLPPLHGPGSDISDSKWGEFVSQSVIERHTSLAHAPVGRALHWQQEIRAMEVVIAAGLYQMDHGKATKNLADLVPDYFPAGLPLDPANGSPFLYEVYVGKPFMHKELGRLITMPSPDLQLVPGQAYIWSEARPVFQMAVPFLRQ
jgi:hypothetical protein